MAQVTIDRCLAGLGTEQARKLCPPDIEVACHNGPNFCTVSGPAESMTKFVKTLQEQGVFAKEVSCGNIAYHSKYVSSAGPLLLRYLKQVKIHCYTLLITALYSCFLLLTAVGINTLRMGHLNC